MRVARRTMTGTRVEARRRAGPPMRAGSTSALVAGWALGAALVAIGAGSALAAVVTGRVVDRAGKPIEYANVTAPALERGTVTDSAGRFSLELPVGPAHLEVTQIGYQHARLEVVAAEGARPIDVVLGEEPVPVAEVQVAASSFGKSGKSEGAVLRRMDVITRP
jgi:hypothetical protein